MDSFRVFCLNSCPSQSPNLNVDMEFVISNDFLIVVEHS